MEVVVSGTSGFAEQWNAGDILSWAFDTYQQHFEIASGFGVEGIVLIDIAAGLQRNLRVFTVDTGFLFPETYTLIERVEQHYGIKVERLRSALTPEAFTSIPTMASPLLWSSTLTTGRSPPATKPWKCWLILPAIGASPRTLPIPNRVACSFLWKCLTPVKPPSLAIR